MQYAGLKVLRIFLGHRDQYLSYEDPPEAYTFENPIGTYHDDNLQKVDFLMAECLKRDIKLIMALATHSRPYLDRYGSTEIYRSSESIQAHKNRFNYFLNHDNAYLSKTWKDCDEVVYAWEIENEAGIPLLDVVNLSSTERHNIIRNFLSELSTYLKTIDPNTKVSLGIAGYANYYHSGKSGDDIRTLGNIKDADIYTLHFYGGNLSQWIDDNLTYCRSLNKLLFIEEFGKERKVGMPALIDLYRSVTQTCRAKGVPWMFWRLGHRKDDNTFSINSDDLVWQQVIAPETKLINQTITADLWGINQATPVNSNAIDQEALDSISCHPNPFNNSIQIHVPTTEKSNIELKIVNIQGREVFKQSLVSAEFLWNGIDQTGKILSNGVYLVIVCGENTIRSQKICLIK